MAQKIEYGDQNKAARGSLTINFKSHYTSTPHVVVCPFWKGEASGVGFPETVTDVNLTSFTVTSNNAANNYRVSWIAISEDE